MKKVFLTAFVAAAFAFSMTACGGNKTAEENTVDSAAQTECCEHHEGCCQENDSCNHEGCCENHEGCCEGHEGCEHQCEHNN